MNVRSLKESVYKRKPNLSPYRNDAHSRERLHVSDCLYIPHFKFYYVSHFQWLEKDFMEYLDEWESSANMREDLSDAEKQKLCISRETVEGLRVTGMNLNFSLKSFFS